MPNLAFSLASGKIGPSLPFNYAFVSQRGGKGYSEEWMRDATKILLSSSPSGVMGPAGPEAAGGQGPRPKNRGSIWSLFIQKGNIVT